MDSSSQWVPVFDGLPCKWCDIFVCAVFTTITNGGGFAGYSRKRTDLSVVHTESKYLFTKCATFLYSDMEKHRAELFTFVFVSYGENIRRCC